jgi:Holliday junction resolvase RusA-like endonuclease
MRRLLSIRLPVEPKVKSRPRFGASGAFTAPETREYERLVAKAVGDAVGVVNYAGPVMMLTAFVVARPKRLRTGPAEWSDKRPDVDNYEKALLDAISMSGWRTYEAHIRAELDAAHKKGVASKTAVEKALSKRQKECAGFWRDDAQLVGSLTLKMYAASDDTPHIRIEMFDAACRPNAAWSALSDVLLAL